MRVVGWVRGGAVRVELGVELGGELGVRLGVPAR